MLILTPDIVFQLADLTQRDLKYDDLILIGEKQVNNQMITQVTTVDIFQKNKQDIEYTYEKIADLRLQGITEDDDLQNLICECTLNKDGNKQLELQFKQNGNIVPYKISATENERKSLHNILDEILANE